MYWKVHNIWVIHCKRDKNVLYCDWLKTSKLMRSQEHVHLFNTVPVVTGTHSGTVCLYGNFTSVVFFLQPQQASQFEAPGSGRPRGTGPIGITHYTSLVVGCFTCLVQNKLQLVLSTKMVLVSELILDWCHLGYITIHISTAECFCFWICLL